MTADRTHYVYRCYDNRDRLLYVGCTGDLRLRRINHRSGSPWFKSATRFRISGPYERPVALGLESDAIQFERPIHNVLGSDVPKTRKQSRGLIVNGFKLRVMRELRGLTCDEVAAGVGVRGASISRIERNVMGASPNTINALAAWFGVDVSEIAYTPDEVAA